MNSESLPTASSSKAADNTEVLSRRIPDQGEDQEAVPVVPEGEAQASGHVGEQTPMDTGDWGRIQFDPQPHTAPETQAAPDSGRPPLPNEGSEPTPPVTSVQLEAPDRLLEALQGASVVEEHRTLMSAVIEKV